MGFTGHKHNNSVGLIYMNARYYVGGIGRFASADTIVPSPTSPQSLNRYTYSLNNPLRYTDPTGHCANDSSWEAGLCWAKVHTIQNVWDDTGFWNDRWGNQESFMTNIAPHEMLGTDFFNSELEAYWNSDEYKNWKEQLPDNSPPPPLDIGEYTVISGTGVPFYASFLGAKLIIDDYGNVFGNIHAGSMPGGNIMRGNVYINDGDLITGTLVSADELSKSEQEAASLEVLPGWSGGISGGWYVGLGANVSAGDNAHVTTEGGIYSPGVAAEIGWTFIIYDSTTGTFLPGIR